MDTTDETVQIYDSGSAKVRQVKNLHMQSYQVPDPVTGEKVGVKGVQFMVVGNNREWPSWIEYDEFVKCNPEIKIQGA